MIEGLGPYSEYRPTNLPWLRAIPRHWRLVRAKSVLRAVDERSKTGQEELLTVSSERGIVPRRTASVTMFKAESYTGHKLCWPEDLVINSLWAWGRGLGVAEEHGIISTAYGVYRRRNRYEVHPGYLHQLVRSTPFQWELQVRSKGVWISRLQLTDTSFLDAPLPVPPPDEQAAIVRFLDHADRRIRRYIRAKQKLIKLLEEQKQAIIHQAVTRGLDPSVPMKHSPFEGYDVVPAHWRALALKRVLVRLVDCEHKTAPMEEGTALHVVRTTAVRHGRLRLSGTYPTSQAAFAAWTRRAVPEAGDVIFTREAPAGEACVVPEGLRVCLGQRTVLLKLRRDEYDPNFLVHMIYGGPPATMIALASQGSTVGHFNMDDIASLPVYVPPLAEQESIVSDLRFRLSSLEAATERAEDEIRLLRELRTRLIADVVTGQLDVRAAAAALPDAPTDDEPLDDADDSGDDDLDVEADAAPEDDDA